MRLHGEDLDAGGRETSVLIQTRVLIVPREHFYEFGLLGQRGFLDRIDEVCIREREQALEVRAS